VPAPPGEQGATVTDEQVREELKNGRIGLAQNRLPASADIKDAQDADVVNALAPLAEGLRRAGLEALRRGELAIVTLAAGAAATVFDQTGRNASGYITSSGEPYSTATFAIESDGYHLGSAAEWWVARELLGSIRIQSLASGRVFVGIAPADAANKYLAQVAHAQAGNLGAQDSDFRVQPGGAPSTLPAAQRFWVAHTSGSGEQTLTWKVRSGDWRVVVMNANGTRGDASQLSIAATFPHLLTIGLSAIGIGLLLLLLSGGTLYLVVRRRR